MCWYLNSGEPVLFSCNSARNVEFRQRWALSCEACWSTAFRRTASSRCESQPPEGGTPTLLRHLDQVDSTVHVAGGDEIAVFVDGEAIEPDGEFLAVQQLTIGCVPDGDPAAVADGDQLLAIAGELDGVDEVALGFVLESGINEGLGHATIGDGPELDLAIGPG